MASIKRPGYKVETKLVNERKRRKSDLVIMWQSVRDVTAILLKELWVTVLRIWELLEVWFSSSERFQVQTWLDKHLSYVPDDFSDSWRDGRLLAILLSKLQPGCFPGALQLDPNCPLQNVYKVFNVLEASFGIALNITAEEMVTCAKGADRKLFELLLQLKQLSESPRASEAVSPPEASVADAGDAATGVSRSCVVKGTGLAVGFVGRMTTFVVFFAKLSELDVVVDIRGPSTSCSERISRRSPKKRLANVQWDLHKSLVRSVSCGDNPASCDPSSGSGEDRLIPLEYEIFGNKVTLSYKPKEKGFHRLSILWHGQHVSDSPYSVYVEDVAELVGADSLAHLKKALKSAREAEATPDPAVRFREAGKPAPEQRKFGKVLSRRVICYVVKVNGQDIPVSAESTESLASELLKMDCEGFQEVHCFRRRNSWGFAGDANRKRSVIRQFGVDPKELELQSSQRRARSQSMNPASEKRMLETSSSCDSLTAAALNVVKEESLDGADSVFNENEARKESAGSSFERSHGGGEEGCCHEEDGDGSSKSLFEGGPFEDTNREAGESCFERSNGGGEEGCCYEEDGGGLSKSLFGGGPFEDTNREAGESCFERSSGSGEEGCCYEEDGESSSKSLFEGGPFNDASPEAEEPCFERSNGGEEEGCFVEEDGDVSSKHLFGDRSSNDANQEAEETSFERSNGGEVEGCYVEEDGDGSSKCFFGDGPCNDTNRESNADATERLEQEEGSTAKNEITDKGSDCMNKSRGVRFDSDIRNHVDSEDITLSGQHAGFEENSSNNNFTETETVAVQFNEKTGIFPILDILPISDDKKFRKSVESSNEGYRLIEGGEWKHAGSENALENTNIYECITTYESGFGCKLIEGNKYTQDRCSMDRNFQSNQADKQIEIDGYVFLNFPTNQQTSGKKRGNLEPQMKSKIVPVNRNNLSETKEELIKDDETTTSPEKGLEDKSVLRNINDCCSTDFSLLRNQSVEKDGNDLFPGIEKHIEKKVAKPSANHFQKARSASVRSTKMNSPAEKKAPLKSHILKPLVQFNFKQFNPNLNFQATSSPVKGQIELWERALTAEEQTVASKGTKAAEIDEGNVKGKLAFWESSLQKRRESCTVSNAKCQLTNQPASPANPTPKRASLGSLGEPSEIEPEQTSPIHSQTFAKTTSGCGRQQKAQTSNVPGFEHSVLKDSENAELGVVAGTPSNHSYGNINDNDSAENISVTRTPDKHTTHKLSNIRRNNPQLADRRSFSDPGLFEPALEGRERPTASPCSNSSKRPTASPGSRSSGKGHSSTSIDDNFEWDDFSTESDDESDAVYHESSGGEFIDDEITGKATEYWGDLQGLEGLCPARRVDGHATWEEEMFKARLQKVKSYPELCVVFGIAAYYGCVSVKNRFEVYTGDAGFGTLSVSVQGFGQDDVTMVSVRRARSSVFEVTYQVMTAGYYLISIRWLDQAIPGSPFVCQVTY